MKQSPYEVSAVQIVAQGPGLLVREFTYAPGEATPWHRHSEVTDLTYGLSGVITVEMRCPDAAQPLSSGERNELSAGRVHRLINHGAEDARILLIQHGGAYDFVVVDADDGGAAAP